MPSAVRALVGEGEADPTEEGADAAEEEGEVTEGGTLRVVAALTAGNGDDETDDDTQHKAREDERQDARRTAHPCERDTVLAMHRTLVGDGGGLLRVA